jgi:pyruvate/2-oxoglutarate dehydrogenase complex dihydrolipoamide acyltransferase (E2) component
MSYQHVPYPVEREIVVDFGRLASRRHIIYGMGELDVSLARQAIRQHKAETGETLSFTAFIIACLGKAVAEQPMVHAYRQWRAPFFIGRGRLILFDEVDVTTMIESEQDRVAIPHIIRAANRKTFRQIHDEIRSVQARPESSPQKQGLARLGPRLPWPLRRLVYWAARKNPHWIKQISGTVVVTSVGMFGSGGGWGLPFLPMHTLGLTLGGIVERPALEQGRLVSREFLPVTLASDHDIVDGAPLARFAARLRELVERGYGVIEP